MVPECPPALPTPTPTHTDGEARKTIKLFRHTNPSPLKGGKKKEAKKILQEKREKKKP